MKQVITISSDMLDSSGTIYLPQTLPYPKSIKVLRANFSDLGYTQHSKICLFMEIGDLPVVARLALTLNAGRLSDTAFAKVRHTRGGNATDVSTLDLDIPYSYKRNGCSSFSITVCELTKTRDSTLDCGPVIEVGEWSVEVEIE